MSRMLFISYRFTDNDGPGSGRCQIPCSDDELVTMDTIEKIEQFLCSTRDFDWVGIMFWQWLEKPIADPQ